MDTNNKAPVYRKRIVVCNLPSLDPIFCVRSPIPAMVIVVHKKTAWTVRGVSCRFSRKKMGKYRMDIPDASPDMISAEMTSIGTILDDDDDVVDDVVDGDGDHDDGDNGDDDGEKELDDSDKSGVSRSLDVSDNRPLS